MARFFSLFFRNPIQCIALYQLHSSQALLNLCRGYFRMSCIKHQTNSNKAQTSHDKFQQTKNRPKYQTRPISGRLQSRNNCKGSKDKEDSKEIHRSRERNKRKRSTSQTKGWHQQHNNRQEIWIHRATKLPGYLLFLKKKTFANTQIRAGFAPSCHFHQKQHTHSVFSSTWIWSGNSIIDLPCTLNLICKGKQLVWLPRTIV